MGEITDNQVTEWSQTLRQPFPNVDFCATLTEPALYLLTKFRILIIGKNTETRERTKHPFPRTAICPDLLPVHCPMAYKIRLSTEETYLLADYMQAATQKRQSRRLLAISLRHYGYAVGDIAKLTGVSEKTVTNWFKRYLEGGLDALLQFHYPKDRHSRLSPLTPAITAFWQTYPAAQVKDLQAWLIKAHQVEVEHSWLYRYLELHDLLPPYLQARRDQSS